MRAPPSTFLPPPDPAGTDSIVPCSPFRYSKRFIVRSHTWDSKCCFSLSGVCSLRLQFNLDYKIFIEFTRDIPSLSSQSLLIIHHVRPQALRRPSEPSADGSPLVRSSFTQTWTNPSLAVCHPVPTRLLPSVVLLQKVPSRLAGCGVGGHDLRRWLRTAVNPYWFGRTTKTWSS